VGQEALELVRAARTIADRYFEVCRTTPGADFDDWRPMVPMINYHGYEGALTRSGLFVGCDVDGSYWRPHVVVTPWGQWVFVGSGREGAGLQFRNNPTFMNGLALGQVYISPSNQRAHMYPVLSIDGTQLPDPQLYCWTARIRAMEHGPLEDEWRELFAAA
jgi:hypothetical protein